MKTVLLAIEGAKPHQSVMSFAVQFCRRMHVALDVVRVIRPEQDLPPALDLCTQEDVSGDTKQADSCSDTHLLKSENPPKAITNYINTHRNIVLAIYDTQAKTRNIPNQTQTGVLLPKGFDRPLAVPLVVMRA